MNITSLIVKCDFELVVNQVKRDYMAKNEELKKYLNVVKELIKNVKHFTIGKILKRRIQTGGFTESTYLYGRL